MKFNQIIYQMYQISSLIKVKSISNERKCQKERRMQQSNWHAFSTYFFVDLGPICKQYLPLFGRNLCIATDGFDE